jgi:hypothetical protein
MCSGGNHRPITGPLRTVTVTVTVIVTVTVRILVMVMVAGTGTCMVTAPNVYTTLKLGQTFARFRLMGGKHHGMACMPLQVV